MTTERWREIERIFESAAALTVQARPGFLERECRGDADLRREVESLLACDSDDDTFAERAVQGTAALLADAGVEPMAGKRVGPYRLTRLIGRGGMGAVYEAVRDDDEYEHRVAIKLLRRGMESASEVRRFRRERQTLSRLNHAHIARLLDGGSTEDGLPFLAMEFVDGVPITSYCREGNLPLEDVLRLFLVVAGAVQYAHQNLVVHSDIKPGNVLVSPDGAPKLLDFGIARLIAEDTDSAAATLTTSRRLTPEFASPEQVRGEPITVASDIYSLGALLYAMLTGHAPHAAAGRSLAAFERIICEAEPPLASAASGRRELKGDIDNILRMALQKETQRRYSSTEKFADDVRRCLEGRTVTARADTLPYRASKFVRRNRVGIAAAALVAGTAAAGAIATLQEKGRAEARYRQVRELAGTLVFDVDKRIANLPGSVEARKFLVDTALRHFDSLAKEAEDDEGLQRELCDGYEKLGRIQAGNLADPKGQGMLPGLGQKEAASASFEKALALQRRLASRNPGRAEHREKLAVLFHHLGSVEPDPRRAIQYFRDGLALVRDGGAPARSDDSLVIELRNGLGHAQLYAGDPKAAEETLEGVRQAFAARIWIHFLRGDITRAVAENVSSIDQQSGRLLRWEPANPRVRIAQYAIGRQRLMMAQMLADPRLPNLGKTQEALHHTGEAILLARALSERDPLDGSARELLGMSYRLDGVLRWDEEPAAALDRLGQAAGNYIVSRWEVAHALRKLGRAADAERELNSALQSTLPEESDEIATRSELAELRRDAGDVEGALRQWGEATARAEAAVARKPYMMPLRASLAACYERIAREFAAKGQTAEALRAQERALAVWREWTRWGYTSPFNERRQRAAESVARRLAAQVP